MICILIQDIIVGHIFFHQKTLSYLSNLWTRENFLLVCIILYENFKNFGSSQNTYVLEGMIFIHQFFYLVPFPFYRYFFVFFSVYISFASGASINHVNRFWDLFEPSLPLRRQFYYIGLFSTYSRHLVNPPPPALSTWFMEAPVSINQ